MELNFGEKIKRLRRSRDLTQEALADALGISAQSVSKWECAYGYPDITQLPAIANFFGVTIDELLNNDKDGKEEALKQFDKLRKDYEEGSEEQIEFVTEYCRRYPDELYYSYVLCLILADHMIRNPEHRTKYDALLHSSAERLLDNVMYRNLTIQCMVNACSEDELDQWLKLAPHNTHLTRRNMELTRYNLREETEKHRLYISLGNLEALTNQLDHRYPDRAGPEAKGAFLKAILDTVSSFGQNGEIPDGWLAFCANKELVYSACLFAEGKGEDGKNAFISAMGKLRRYHSLTKEYLDTGSSLFGGLRVDKKWLFAMDQKGVTHKLLGTASMMLYGKPSYILSLLTNPRWAWFDSARNEDYYKEAVEWLGELANTASH